jgi:hypothetical protein
VLKDVMADLTARVVEEDDFFSNARWVLLPTRCLNFLVAPTDEGSNKAQRREKDRESCVRPDG